ncbi:Rib/alpha-like domain-containing protein, partial [Peptoniphilus phoceensis]|uniref:Rib/alpha-like domain-containing protein n=1 Tax=Peptoniphilus phoceensis TaxID=1720298 RepID=UPI000A85A8FE
MDNKKKKFNTNRVAAYALSGVMLASMVPYNVFANPEQAQNALTTAAAASEPRLALSPDKAPVAVRDAAPPEDTDTASDAKNAVHGYVGVQVGDDVNKNLAKAGKGQFIPKEGVKVYFQWYEKKGNRVSPVYAATSDATGQFHMKIKSYIGEDGKLVKFDADTTVSAGNESYKFWVDESTIPEGYQLQYSTGESVEFTDRGVAGANYSLGDNTLTDMKVLLMEIPKEDLMHKQDKETPAQIFKTDPGQGAVRGKVSWDYESAGGIQWGIVATHTSPAPEVKVRASYLSDYALKQIFSADTANMLGVSSPSKIRGSGWTFNLEKQLQDWIKEQVEKDPDKWIAETVSAVTNAEGDYKIQFNGTWGPERNGVNVAEYNRVAGKYYAGDAHKWTEEEVNRLGTVANSPEEGSFLTGALNHNEKHINSDWLFISTEGTDKLRVMTPWNNNWYTGSNNAWGIHGGWAQAAFGVSTVLAANSTRADFVFAPAEIKFNITNYDTGNNYATPGDEAKTETKGLPYSHTSDSFRIVWYDAKGNVVKTENAAKPSSTGDFPEATLDTSDVTETKTFTAKLYRVDAKGNNGQLLAQDSFTVKISKLVVSAHDEVSIPNPGANDESMKGATYSAEGLPEGLTIDLNNGTISGKATTPGKYTVTVKTTVPDEDSGEPAEGISQYVALVTDSPLKDGNVNSQYTETVKPSEVDGYVFKNVSAKFIDGKAIDGLTITGDKITGTPTAKVDATEEDPNVEVTYDIYKLNEKGDEVLIKKGHVDKVPLSIKDGQSAQFEPEYTGADAEVGKPTTITAPNFKDKDGKDTTKPEGTKFALGKDAPAGAEINPETGEIKYTPAEDKAGQDVEIPVVVTYPDGTTDEVKATVTVAEAETPAEKTATPKVTEPKAGDTTVSGTATPGATVKVTLPDGTVKETKADDQGNWTVDTPA